MSNPTVFLLGATGHIGTAILHHLLNLPHQPAIHIVALVRDASRLYLSPHLPAEALTRLRIVHGDLTTLALLEEEARAATVVINATPDTHPASPAAIAAVLRGLGTATTTTPIPKSPSKRREGGYYIHTSGAFLILNQPPPGGAQTWSDIHDIHPLLSLPSSRPHAQADAHVRALAAQGAVRLAIVSPTVVHGLVGSGRAPLPLTQRAIVAAVRRLGGGGGRGYVVDGGRNVLGYVHVDDLAGVYGGLVLRALGAGREGEDGEGVQVWGPAAYYFVVAEELEFRVYMERLVGVVRERLGGKGEEKEGEGLMEVGEGRPGWEVVGDVVREHGCGVSVRCRADRAARLLGWKPRRPGVLETLPEVVEAVLARERRGEQ